MAEICGNCMAELDADEGEEDVVYGRLCSDCARYFDHKVHEEH